MFAEAEAGSPKFQPHPVTEPGVTVDPSVKQVVSPKHTGRELKSGVGKGFIKVGSATVSLQPSVLVTIKVAVKVPAAP